MLNFLSFALSALLLSSPAPSIPFPRAVPVSQWQPQAGDAFLADTQSNTGYIVRIQKNKTLVATFPIVTGQRRTVWYIGHYYNATTPAARWTVKSVDIKGDRTTFGTTG